MPTKTQNLMQTIACTAEGWKFQWTAALTTPQASSPHIRLPKQRAQNEGPTAIIYPQSAAKICIHVKFEEHIVITVPLPR